MLAQVVPRLLQIQLDDQEEEQQQQQQQHEQHERCWRPSDPRLQLRCGLRLSLSVDDVAVHDKCSSLFVSSPSSCSLLCSLFLCFLSVSLIVSFYSCSAHLSHLALVRWVGVESLKELITAVNAQNRSNRDFKQQLFSYIYIIYFSFLYLCVQFPLDTRWEASSEGESSKRGHDFLKHFKNS